MEEMPIPQESIAAKKVLAQQTVETMSVATQPPPIEPMEIKIEPPEVKMT